MKKKRERLRRINKKHKDRLFRYIFQEKEDILELYNAINGTDYNNPEDLEITTLDNAIYMSMKNDLSFLVEDTLNLYEHQSTFNPNLPLRGLLYFASVYREYVRKEELDIYGSTLRKLPAPRYIVFYNGSKNEPDRKELFLSDAFLSTGTKEDHCLECKAVMLNINLGNNKILMEKCQKLHEYAQFVATIREYIYQGANLREAVEQAVEDCIREGILAEVLMKQKSEVVEVILTEYDEKKHLDNVREEGRKEGRKAGQKEGEQRLGRLIQNLMRDGRMDEIERVSIDAAYREKMYKEYGL